MEFWGGMEGMHVKWRAFKPLFTVIWSFALASIFVSAERNLKNEASAQISMSSDSFLDFLWQGNSAGYHHVWPELEFGWKLIIASFISFVGAAFGSIGGVGGGGIFVPMLTLVVGFDAKSATAISKCMIMGASASAVYYNLKLRHPTLNMPLIDYDLAVLIQPMLMLGISIGVIFNVLFPDWLVTILLIVLFTATSSKAFSRGVETWKKETIMKKEAARRNEATGGEAEYRLLPEGPTSGTGRQANVLVQPKVSFVENVYWKEFGLLCFVWAAFLTLQLIKNYTSTCSVSYWLVNILQIPVSVGVSGFEAVGLYEGRRKLASQGSAGAPFRASQLILYCSFGVLAGIVGGLLGLGGGFIMGPLFLELGVPPQVSSATATFAMLFSSSMSVVEYHLLRRFPVPYALYFMAVATVAAFIGQHVVRKFITMLGRASIIIFVLAFTIFFSSILLGGVGIHHMIGKIHRHEYMGFENLCKYEVNHKFRLLQSFLAGRNGF